MTIPTTGAPRHRYFRTDVRYMRKGELFRSAGEFLVCGALGIAWWAVGYAVSPLVVAGKENVLGWIVGLAMLAMMFVGGMGLIGGTYLLVRACLRSGAYDPHKVWLGDEPRSMENEL